MLQRCLVRTATSGTKLSTLSRCSTKSRKISSISIVNVEQLNASRSSLFRNVSSINKFQSRFFASGAAKVVKVPPMGDSITEGTIGKWTKGVGTFVKMDEVVATIETDKVNVEIRAPEDGVISEVLAKEGDTVKVGAELYKLDTSQKAPAGAQAEAKKETGPATPKAEPAKKEAPKAEAPKAAETSKAAPPKAEPAKKEVPKAAEPSAPTGPRESRVKMTRIRIRTAERLKDSQNTYAMLTTFNEVDMSGLIEMRNRYKDDFEKKYGIKIGFMSPFVKAAAQALTEQPIVNGVIDGQEIIYRNYIDISVAVASPTGLVVPVIRNADRLSFAGVEKAIADLSKKAKDGTLAIEDMQGGTFTISNGGVFGSLMGTPIINPPQSAILGMHATKERAVVVNGQVVARPMMYIALTYDHRLIDGREAVTFLKRIKELIEDPRRFLLEI